MKNFNYKFLEVVSTKAWVEKINKLKEEDWYEWTEKQDVSIVHSKTSNIGLKYDIDYGANYIREGKESKFYEYFYDELNAVELVIKKYYGDGKILRAELARLHKHCSVPNHIDKGVSLYNNNRIHLPIITDPKVKFWVKNETTYMKEGHLTEINNVGEHGVENNSNIDRIHLIIDYYTSPASIL